MLILCEIPPSKRTNFNILIPKTMNKAERGILKGIKKRVKNGKKPTLVLKSLRECHKLIGISGLRD